MSKIAGCGACRLRRYKHGNIENFGELGNVVLTKHDLNILRLCLAGACYADVSGAGIAANSAVDKFNIGGNIDSGAFMVHAGNEDSEGNTASAGNSDVERQGDRGGALDRRCRQSWKKADPCVEVVFDDSNGMTICHLVNRPA